MCHTATSPANTLQRDCSLEPNSPWKICYLRSASWGVTNNKQHDICYLFFYLSMVRERLIRELWGNKILPIITQLTLFIISLIGFCRLVNIAGFLPVKCYSKLSKIAYLYIGEIQTFLWGNAQDHSSEPFTDYYIFNCLYICLSINMYGRVWGEEEVG